MVVRRKETLLELCGRATTTGNSIAVRLLEYLGTVKSQPDGFRELAVDFMDVCRILFSLEAGMTEATRTQNQFPTDMISELDRRFRQVNDDFLALNQMLGKYLEYERKGGFSKIRKGLHMMFTTDIDKIRAALVKSRDALKMSALVFRWSLGDERADSSMGIGYTGLAAVLDSMNGPRTTPVHPKPASVRGTPSVTGTPVPAAAVPAQSMLTALPTPAQTPVPAPAQLVDSPGRLPPLPPINMNGSSSAYTLFPRNDDQYVALPPMVERQSTRHVPSTRSSKITTHSATRDRDLHFSLSDTAPTEITAEELGSTRDADSMTEIEDMIHEIEVGDKLSSKVVRIKADPSTVPRWTPKQTTGANSAPLKAALVTAVQQRKHKMIEQLLDCGVPAESGPEINLLREAIVSRDAESVRLLLLFGANPDRVDKNGLTPLYSATELGFLEGAKLLMKYGGDANLAAGADAETPLIMAVADNKASFVQLYLTYGGDANLMLDDGNTLLIKAIDKTVPKNMIELMLNYGSDPNGKNGEGQTPLFQAISAKRVDIMTVLLDHGADPNLPGPKHLLWPSTYQPQALQLLLSRGAETKKCSGILELATSINNMESVQTLLKAGVDPNAKKDGTYTPLCSAIRDNRGELVTLLLANGADPNVMASEYPAFKCVTHHRTHFLPQVVAAGADLHKPKGILEKAVAHNNKEALVYLLEQHVSPNDRSPEGNTPLTTAIRDDRIEFMDLLLANGADPSIRGQDWPICMAVKRPTILKKLLPSVHNPRAVKGVMEMAVVANQLESIKLLLEAGVSVEDKNGGVFSPLTTAIREDRKEIVQYLLDEAGADVNAPGEHLPIIKSIRRYRGDTSIIEMLLARGADINLMYRGWNAVLQAVENGDVQILRLLVERGGGVDLQVTDDSGRTVMDIVTERGWDEAVTLLTGASGPSA